MLLPYTSNQTATNQSVVNIHEELQPIQDRIDQARDALGNNDGAKALEELNSADSGLLRMTQEL